MPGILFYLFGYAFGMIVGYRICRRRIVKAGLCPTHFIKMKVRGYYNEEYCPTCWEENRTQYE